MFFDLGFGFGGSTSCFSIFWPFLMFFGGLLGS